MTAFGADIPKDFKDGGFATKPPLRKNGCCVRKKNLNDELPKRYPSCKRR